MTISEPIVASFIGVAAVVLVATLSAWGHINSRLGRVERGQDLLAAEIRASREHFDRQLTAAEERAIARHEAAMAEIRAVEERALARHNELLAEIRLWRVHGHDADGNIFFRVPE